MIRLCVLLISSTLVFSTACALEKSSDGRVRTTTSTGLGPTNPQPSTNPPAPPPTPITGCATFRTGLEIVTCNRAKWGTMSQDDIVNFLKSVARDLNSAKIAGYPFGILRKTGGNNCLGYACDIVCAGNGTSQRQWDVLVNTEGTQAPTWRPVTSIRRDTCEIQ